MYLFDAKQLLEDLNARGVKTGVASSVIAGQWAAAEIYPQVSNPQLTLSTEQRELLRLFASDVIAPRSNGLT